MGWNSVLIDASGRWAGLLHFMRLVDAFFRVTEEDVNVMRHVSVDV